MDRSLDKGKLVSGGKKSVLVSTHQIQHKCGNYSEVGRDVSDFCGPSKLKGEKVVVKKADKHGLRKNGLSFSDKGEGSVLRDKRKKSEVVSNCFAKLSRKIKNNFADAVIVEGESVSDSKVVFWFVGFL
ncbi:hypothetical protein Q3G72_018329 [Acer saccharum]|nr:hypothetical protein Q3G72_018329 [Acer saccharum]